MQESNTIALIMTPSTSPVEYELCLANDDGM